jgi:hypothetical protein
MFCPALSGPDSTDCPDSMFCPALSGPDSTDCPDSMFCLALSGPDSTDCPDSMFWFVRVARPYPARIALTVLPGLSGRGRRRRWYAEYAARSVRAIRTMFISYRPVDSVSVLSAPPPWSCHPHLAYPRYPELSDPSPYVGTIFSRDSLPAPQVVLGLVGGINHRAAVPLYRPGSSALGCGVCAYVLPK